MDGPISVAFSDIYMCKMEEDVEFPVKRFFYKGYVNGTYVHRIRNTKDELLKTLNA